MTPQVLLKAISNSSLRGMQGLQERVVRRSRLKIAAKGVCVWLRRLRVQLRLGCACAEFRIWAVQDSWSYMRLHGVLGRYPLKRTVSPKIR